MSVIQQIQTELEVGDAPQTRLYAVLGEWTSPDALLSAAGKVREAGYTKFDCYSPFPIHGIDDAMGTRQTRLPWLVLAGGFAGATAGLVLCWYTMATMIPDISPTFSGYPYIISGKPMFSLAAFIPVIFEMTILLSAFAAVFGMLGFNKLPTLYNPLFRSPRFRRATADRFFLAIEADDPKFDVDEVEALLSDLDAVHVEQVED